MAMILIRMRTRMRTIRERRMKIIVRFVVTVGTISGQSLLYRVGETHVVGCARSLKICIGCIIRRTAGLRAGSRRTNTIGGIICAGKPLKSRVDRGQGIMTLSLVLTRAVMLAVRLGKVCKSEIMG
jgi:hypothetical protein